MRTIDRILLAAVFLVFFFIHISTLNNGHNWGDDFAQYILHALNLVEHKPYSENIALDLWTVVPPGFPLLLSSIIYWSGINFKILKFLNIVCWALTALAGYFLAVRRMRPRTAAVFTVWLLSVPFFFFFKQNVLSDIPFLCFVSLSIWAFTKAEEKSVPLLYGVAAVLLGYAVMIRWAGLALFLAAVLHMCINGKRKEALGFAGAALISAGIVVSFGSSAAGHFGSTQYTLHTWAYAVWMNIAFIPTVILDFVMAEPVSKAAGPAVFLIFKFLGPVFVIAGMLVFFARFFQRKVGFLGWFTLLYLLGIIVWPVQQGLSRYILPLIIPLGIYFIVEASRILKEPLAEKVLVGLFALLIVQNAAVIAFNFRFNDDNIYQKETLEMAGWVNDHVLPDDHFMFYKPRALRLLSGRTGTAFWVYPQERQYWHLRVEDMHIRYLIADKKLDDLARYDSLNLPAKNSELLIQKVWENSGYKIFEVK